ncbi:MAG TPA: DUF427 domain-containing protein [Phototrophicaceae bacterium]|jgi:uncharacterized protein (DUF427 family)|nr:DUF427 domain-containing protein [Phototrophicaceae bacterium]
MPSPHIQPQKPEAHQESVWDYPRPPRVEASSKIIRVIFNDEVIAETTHAMRVVETSHPPVYYIPQADIHMEYLQPTARHTFCEFKGAASYWTIKVGDQIEVNAAWSYADPSHGFETIKNYIAFYPGRMDACYVNDEKVKPQEGDFYGGWITSDIVGPFKGALSTSGKQMR